MNRLRSLFIIASTLALGVTAEGFAGVPNLAAPTPYNLQQSAENEQLHTLQEQNQQNQITSSTSIRPLPGLSQMNTQNQMLLNQAQTQANQGQLPSSMMPSLEEPVQQEQMALSNPAMRALP